MSLFRWNRVKPPTASTSEERLAELQIPWLVVVGFLMDREIAIGDSDIRLDNMIAHAKPKDKEDIEAAAFVLEGRKQEVQLLRDFVDSYGDGILFEDQPAA